MSGFTEWLGARAAAREDAGLTRRLFASDAAGPMIDLAGNDYLGLARHPRVVAGAVEAAQRYGAGAGASRLVTGTLTVHDDLEHALADFTGFPSALAFSTGYHANLAAVSSLADADTLIVSDAHVHASMIDACRLSRGVVTVVPHNDVAAVERFLAARTQPRALVLVETIYSVLGDAAPVAELADVCARHDAVLVADEAHALGVCGDGGRGLLHEAGLSGQDHVVATLTLSKSLGAQGGAVLATPAVRDHLVNTARPFIYDTGLAPAAAGAALAALGVILDEPERVDRVRTVARALAKAGGVREADGAVLAIAMPGPREAVDAVAQAAELGVRIGCFRPPSTPDGISRLRLTAHAHLTDAEVETAARVVEGLLGVTVLFVTGTDTGVGKTVTTAALVVALRASGASPYVIKPAQTGVGPDDPSDLDDVRRLAGDVPGHEGVRLREPLAPGTAARLEGADLPGLAEQRDAVVAAAADHEVVVEGAGGLLVNLGKHWNLLDLAQAVAYVGIPVGFVVVARAGLGTLNHTALTVQAIQHRELTVHGLVIGSWPADPDLAATQNLLDLPLLTGVPVLGRIPEGSGDLAAAEFAAGVPDWVTLPPD